MLEKTYVDGIAQCGCCGLHVTQWPRSFTQPRRTKGQERGDLVLVVTKTGESGNIMTKLFRERNEVGIWRSSTKCVFLEKAVSLSCTQWQQRMKLENFLGRKMTPRNLRMSSHPCPAPGYHNSPFLRWSKTRTRTGIENTVENSGYLWLTLEWRRVFL